MEDRFLPAVDFFGGPIIPNVEVNTLFLGQQWNANSTNSLNSLEQGMNSYLQMLVNSPYMDMLAQYNVGHGSFGTTINDWLTDDPYMQTVMDDNQSYSGNLTELQYLIVNAIDEGWLATPNANQLYIVFLPPGEQLVEPGGTLNNDPSNGFLGYHSSFSSQYGRINYAVMPFPGGPYYFAYAEDAPTEFDSLTATVSHELSEAVTDPIPPSTNPVQGTTGWMDPEKVGSNLGDEIGDIVNQDDVYWNGYVVQEEANAQDQGMIPQLPSSGVFGLSVPSTANQSFNGTVMNFTDNSTSVYGDTTAQPLDGSPLQGSSFNVTINWGDGQTSSGQVVYDSNGQYSVVASHSYAQSGSYQISMSVTDTYGTTASADSTVTVDPSQPGTPPNYNPTPTQQPPTWQPTTQQPPSPATPDMPPLLVWLNQAFGEIETVNANDTTITDSLFGMSLVETYNSSGNLESLSWGGFNVLPLLLPYMDL